ncbi:hypothetical protein [Demequina mangrovi]|uniref:Poly-beta-1,6-N-acetyl-D-glucosamine biosynthesis protein PgaD n=1 Tax=Demequina mangrovi TaxID=1043493 RepID=A0A1H6TLC7_9MICO|nr:hypothetical protein [Demequina mangrovi]SEI80873.1 hypothetical protein SAMN05421637_0067 [Demequina mangrovi]
MTDKPAYIVHEVNEKDVTVDWFFTRWRSLRPVGQLIVVLISWFFALAPIVITASSLYYEGDPDRGWWGYHEGFVIWKITVAFLALILVFYLVFFLVLHLVDRAQAKKRARITTYDEERLAKRLEIAEDWYEEKFGPEALRHERRAIRIEGHGDIETYELRSRYRDHGVD